MKGTQDGSFSRMKNEFGGMTGKFMVVLVAVGLLWMGATGVGLADLRIVEESEGVRSEMLYKNNRIAATNPAGFNTLLFCDVQEFVLMSQLDQRYWQGHFSEVQAAVEAIFSPEGMGALFGLDDDEAGDIDFGQLFGSLFGAGGQDSAEPLQVRVTRVGEDTIAGYDAEHYVVETGRGGQWDVFEEMWISPALFAEVRREVGACMSMMMEVQSELLSGFGTGLDDLDAVLTSEEYLALTERGYPMRSKESTTFFGMTFEIVSEVVEVSRDPIPDSAFAVPAGYERVENLMDLIMSGGGF